MTRLNSLLKTAAAAAAVSAMAFAGGAAAADTIRVDQGGDITKLCGDKPLRIAHVDGYGGDTWRKITHAELKDEASKCPNIGEIPYAEANGDPQAYAAAINGFASQGYDIIIAFTDFGDAAIPAYRGAQQAGVTMVPYFNNLGGKLGTDYAVNPYQDSFEVGKQFGEWIGKSVKKGNTVMLGGFAGAASSTVFINGYKEGLKNYPDIKLLDENFIVTNWNPADAQKAAAGLIAKYPQIDAIASDYGVTTLATIKAFEQAGLKVPAMATIATSNELSCKYLEGLKAGTAWPYLAVDGSTADIRFTLRQALAAKSGFKIDEPLGVVPYVYADSAADIKPKCLEGAPPDADTSSLLPEAKLFELFK